jgi:AbrB family looped-hinge helix DNA binding protein
MKLLQAKLAQSRLTAQGQISVPAEVRRRLGVGPGSVLEWEEQGGQVVVRKAGQHSSADVHEALFGGTDTAAASPDVKEGIRKYMRKRHARS